MAFNAENHLQKVYLGIFVVSTLMGGEDWTKKGVEFHHSLNREFSRRFKAGMPLEHYSTLKQDANFYFLTQFMTNHRAWVAFRKEE